ncbi:transcriptional regulator [Paucilactobacillus hokkaidonensis JCM 18461]|uniref:Transcriptional regulator n=2 Tax=Paucilactobacillus hokkaidonensis TaxID=1193095 RepID=A0A0A1GU27_9LACO|nr:helix-turn-helix transcriptional regulator [Paucilactobacillus hokkaidonensis]KRO07355.1 hypothetical protein IV59_GL001875 [Paucilactobacillus hokkaidonensis]BAP85490.1 transcriptional regulator [Paucilactobacillus hokkaidonensis JCM 18461]
MTMTLKALRANQDLNQEDAAKKIGVTKWTWANYENGKSFPNIMTIKKIEKEFDVKYSDINFLP